MRVHLFLAAALSVGSNAGLAQTSPAPVGPSASADATQPKPICRRQQVTGSNLPVKTCHTAAEWKDIDNPSVERRREMAEMIKPKS